MAIKNLKDIGQIVVFVKGEWKYQFYQISLLLLNRHDIQIVELLIGEILGLVNVKLFDSWLAYYTKRREAGIITINHLNYWIIEAFNH